MKRLLVFLLISSCLDLMAQNRPNLLNFPLQEIVGQTIYIRPGIDKDNLISCFSEYPTKESIEVSPEMRAYFEDQYFDVLRYIGSRGLEKSFLSDKKDDHSLLVQRHGDGKEYLLNVNLRRDYVIPKAFIDSIHATYDTLYVQKDVGRVARAFGINVTGETEEAGYVELRLNRFYYNDFGIPHLDFVLPSGQHVDNVLGNHNGLFVDKASFRQIAGLSRQKVAMTKRYAPVIMEAYQDKKIYTLKDSHLNHTGTMEKTTFPNLTEFVLTNVISIENKQGKTIATCLLSKGMEHYTFESTFNRQSGKLEYLENRFIVGDPSLAYPQVSMWNAIRAGEIVTGMTQQEVQLSWGSPAEVQTDEVTGTIVWKYPSEGGFSLFFEDGRLKSFSN